MPGDHTHMDLSFNVRNLHSELRSHVHGIQSRDIAMPGESIFQY